MTTVTVTAAKTRFFDDIISATALTAASGLGLDFQFHDNAGRYSERHYITLEGKRGHNVRIMPFSVLSDLARDAWPRKLEFHLIPCDDDSPPSHLTWLTGAQRFAAAPWTPLILRYFDGHKDIAARAWGPDRNAWPDVWRFGWMIRNAIAHDGLVNVQDKSVRPAEWRGLQVGPQDHGSLVVFGLLGLGDFVLLAIDMDEALPR